MRQFLEIMHPKPRVVDGFEVRVPRLKPPEVDALFERTIQETPGLYLCRQKGQSNRHGRRLVVGTVTWSSYDLRSLDELSAAALELERQGVHIEIFDVDGLYRKQGKFEELISGLGEVHQTPVVGIWENGKQIAGEQGFKARQMITAFIRDFGTKAGTPVPAV